MWTKKQTQTAFDTFNWRKYLPFWKENGTPMIEFMNENKIPFREWDGIFEEWGIDFYEIMKKLTLDMMVSPEFKNMSDNEKAMIGPTIFLEFMKQLHIEIMDLDSVKE